MLRIPKEYEGRYATLLLAGIPTVEVKISKITDEEIIAKYGDDEEVHMDHSKLVAWWPKVNKEARIRKMMATKAKNAEQKRSEVHQIEDNSQDGTNTQEED